MILDSNDDGKVYAYQANNGDNQKWYLVDKTMTINGTSVTGKQIKNFETGRCLDSYAIGDKFFGTIAPEIGGEASKKKENNNISYNLITGYINRSLELKNISLYNFVSVYGKRKICNSKINKIKIGRPKLISFKFMLLMNLVFVIWVCFLSLVVFFILIRLIVLFMV